MNELVVRAYVFLADLLEEIRDHGEGGAPDSYRPGELEKGIRLAAGALSARMTDEEMKSAHDGLF